MRMPILWRFDMSVFRFVNIDLHSPVLDPFFCFLSYVGLGHVQFVLCLLFLLNKETKRLVAPLLVTILVTGVLLADVIKDSIVHRERPSNLGWAIAQEPHRISSFPSGHTSTSFGIATMMILLTRGTKMAWMGWVSLVLAALIGMSRMYRGVHWPTDVLGGIGCGVFGACLVYVLMKPYNP